MVRGSTIVESSREERASGRQSVCVHGEVEEM